MAPSAQASATLQRVDQYVHRAWTTADGLPQNTIYAIVHGADGYLWLGTDEGLVRFDGLRFAVFDRSNTPAITDPFVFALAEGPDGSIWAGTDRGGVIRFHAGRFSRFGEESGLPPGRVQALAVDGTGSVWVGLRGGGLARLRDGRFTVFSAAEGLCSNNVLALHEDRQGRVWVGTDHGLDWFDGGRFVHARLPHDVADGGIRAIYEDHAGRLWIGAIDGPLGERVLRGGLAVAERGDQFHTVALADGRSMPGVMAIVEDADGQLWLGTATAGVGRLRNGRIESRALTSPFNEFVYALVVDNEGDLWVGTQPHGLHRLQKSRVLTYTRADGLRDDVIESLLEDRNGTMWVGTHAGGLCRIDAGTPCLTTADGLAHNRVNAVVQDPDGTLWLGTEGGLDELHAGRIRHYSTRDGLPLDHVNALLRDRAGALWVGTWGGGVARLRGGRFDAFDAALSGRYVNTMYQGRRGTIWIGTTDGLAVVDDGRMTNATKDRGMPAAVEAIDEDADGNVWIGTRRDGLFLESKGHLTRFTIRQGLFDNLVGTIVEDRSGYFWFTCNKGISRVRRQDLLDVAAGVKQTVASRAFDTTDGMANQECDFGQGSCRTRDGRLWFATVGGVVVVDPSAMALNTVPPHVQIEEVTVDGEPLPLDRPQTFEYGRQHLEFHFAGISLSAAERVRYRYKLEGFDQNWIDGREARSTRYTNLPPGRYRFVVTASNGDGVWNPQGTSYAFAVATPIWRRPAFALSLVGLAAAMLVAIAQFRVARLQHARARQEAFSRQLIATQEHERKRLAGDLHDGIGQHLLVIGNWARIAMSAPSSSAHARAALEVITESAAKSMREIRTLTRELQPYELEHLGLPDAIRTMLDRLAESSGTRFAADLEAAPTELPSDMAINVYRVAQEAANNVVKHARATEVQVTLRFRVSSLELTITDNGCGFAVTAAGASAGFGLRSIEERARLLGGTYEVQSVPGRGTIVAIRVPLPASGDAHAI